MLGLRQLDTWRHMGLGNTLGEIVAPKSATGNNSGPSRALYEGTCLIRVTAEEDAENEYKVSFKDSRSVMGRTTGS